MKKTFGIMMIMAMVAALTLTVNPVIAKDKMSKSGFLKDYSMLKKGPKDGADYVYLKKGVDFKDYDKIMMDHVVFFFSEDSKYKGIHADELKDLADAFHKVMVDALQGAYPFVEDPGPGVLRIRPALTEVKAANPALNTISTVMPIGLGISTLKKAATGTHTGVGGATLEAEFLDAQSNEVVGMVVDKKMAGKTKLVEGMSKWGHAKESFEFWAERLKKWLDEQHGK